MVASSSDPQKPMIQIYRPRRPNQQYNGIKSYAYLPPAPEYACYICRHRLYLLDYDLSNNLHALEMALMDIEVQHNGCGQHEVCYGAIIIKDDLKEMRFFRGPITVDAVELAEYLRRVFIHRAQQNYIREADQLFGSDPVVYLDGKKLGNLSTLVETQSDIGLD
jgi:hypothetical protein